MSWQLIQSKIAMGSGRVFGKGFLAGTQKKLEFLPERHTDFIFSCIGEEFGFIGTGILLALYFILSYRILLVAKESHNEFNSLVAVGIWAMLSYQIVLNVGMTIGIFPVTGVPLPFVSYGGSSLLVNFIAVGIVLSLSRRRLEY
jgi:rod shape determining protein RodA